MSKWTCNKCRDRGDIVRLRPDGTREIHNCPECNADGQRFVIVPHDGVDMTDYGYGLPEPEQAERQRQ